MKKPKKGWVMGIDPSLTGFAVVLRPLVVGEQELSFRYTSKFKGVDRLLDIQAWLSHIVEEVTGFNVLEIAMEGYAMGAKWNREAMGELGGMVKVELARMLPSPMCYPTIVPPLTLKKWVTGKGNAPKDQMVIGVYKKWGFDAPSNDEADAYALARLATCMLGLDQPKFAYEKQILEGLHRWTEKRHNSTY